MAFGGPLTAPLYTDMSVLSDAISTYYTALVTASTLNAGEQAYAQLCLSQWCAAEDALTTTMAATLASYSISGRTATRITNDNQISAAAQARARFFEACHGFVTYIDIHDADESVAEVGG
jgi:hypothetical protein